VGIVKEIQEWKQNGRNNWEITGKRSPSLFITAYYRPKAKNYCCQ